MEAESEDEEPESDENEEPDSDEDEKSQDDAHPMYTTKKQFPPRKLIDMYQQEKNESGPIGNSVL